MTEMSSYESALNVHSLPGVFIFVEIKPITQTCRFDNFLASAAILNVLRKQGKDLYTPTFIRYFALNIILVIREALAEWLECRHRVQVAEGSRPALRHKLGFFINPQ